MNNLSFRTVLQIVGALVLLLILWMGKHLFAFLGIPVLIGLLLVSWNRPERMRFLFGERTSKTVVRLGLGAALIVCLGIINTAPSAPSPSPGTNPRLANGEGEEPNVHTAPVNDAATELRARKAEERIRVAENRVRQAEIAERRAKRAQERLEQKQRQEGAKKRETLAEEQREREQTRRETARRAALPTATPVDPNAPEKDILGYHKVNATANMSRYGVEFINNDPFDYTEVYATLNPTLLGGFRCDYAPLQIPSGQKVFVSFQRFFDGNSRRFSIVDYKLTKIILTCRTKYGKGSGTFTFTGDIN